MRDVPVAVKTFTAKDLTIIASLPVSFAVAWSLPEPLWHGVAQALSPLAARGLASRRQAMIAGIERLVGDRPLASPPQVVIQETVAGHIEEYLQTLREYRPFGWRPAIRLEGRNHVDAALQLGRGAILWIGYFTFAGLVAKKAFHQDGFRVSHLSHPFHGFSQSRFGMRRLNRLRRHVEDRYLHERVMLGIDSSTAAMRLLHRRLRKNAVVSVTVRERAQRPVVVPFLDGTIALATGAADLAYATKAALLPVSAVREAEGTFRVVVDRPLELRHEVPRREATALALREYARRLEPIVLDYPGQWRGWLNV